MADPLLFVEQPFDLEFKTDSYYVDFPTQHPKARVLDAMGRIERNPDGTIAREYGVLIVKDRGYVSRQPIQRQRVVVVRATGAVTGLPSDAGEYVARFSSHHSQHTWFVFREVQRLEQIVSRVLGERAKSPPRSETPKASGPASPPKPTSEGDDLW